MNYFDSHCHINGEPLLSDAEGVLSRARAAGVTRVGVIGTTLADSAVAVALCREHAGYGLFPVVGVHPHEASSVADGVPRALLDLAALPEVLAWGEIGLDYCYDLSPRDAQIRALTEQLEAAKALGKKVVFHVRDAFDDFWRLMTPDIAPERAEVHCFTGSAKDAKRALDRGWMLGFTGMITFKSCGALREIVRSVPLESVLCETDAPWLTPAPFRGARNEPCRVPLVCRAVAEARGIPPEEAAARIWENSLDFWELR